MMRATPPFLTAFLLSLAIVPVGSAQHHASSGRHLDAFRSDGELTKYFSEVALARRRAEEQRIKADPCLRDVSVRKSARRSAPGDSTVIAGTTRDAAGNLLSAVSVRVLGQTERAISDASGRFRLVIGGSGAPNDRKATLLATRIGLIPRRQEVRLRARDSLTIDLPLCQVNVALEEVVVVGYGTEKDESITNIQEAAVDEGGIVKLHGRHLIVLRRGRLFTIEIGDRSMRTVSAVDAFGPDKVVFGGDWPVCLVRAPLATWIDTLKQIVATRPQADQEKLWSSNAKKFYALEV